VYLQKSINQNTHSPVVKWRHALDHRLAKFFTNLLNRLINLPIAFNIKNTPRVINELSEINIHSDVGLASVGNWNVYTNIPVIQLRRIIESILNQNLIEVKQKHRLINIFGLVINQSYFCLNGALFCQKVGLAMGAPAPSSAVHSEILYSTLNISN
jgi:hypothetical protein